MAYLERRWMLRNPFMWAVVVIVAPVLGYAALDAGFHWTTLAPLLAVAVVLSLHLRTRIDGATLHVGVLPIWNRRVELHAVHSARRIPYRWRNYGGWGIRFGDGATAYSCWEQEAVRLEMDGRDLVIGTGRPEALLAELQAHGVTLQSDKA